jgi:hypothetical protein
VGETLLALYDICVIGRLEIFSPQKRHKYVTELTQVRHQVFMISPQIVRAEVGAIRRQAITCRIHN